MGPSMQDASLKPLQYTTQLTNLDVGCANIFSKDHAHDFIHFLKPVFEKSED